MNIIYVFLMQAVLFAMHFTIEALNEKRPLNKNSFLYIIYDEFLHVSLYCIIMLPFIHYARLFLIGAAASVLIDIDHVIAAGSVRINKMITLPSRPFTHSLTYALMFSAVLLIVFRDTAIAGAVFAGIAIHLLRDMISGKTMIFFPVKSISHLKKSGYVFISMSLIVLSCLLYFLI